MLKYIRYLVTEYYYEILLTKQGELEKSLLGHSVKFSIQAVPEEQREVNEFLSAGQTKEETLFISDEPEIVGLLQRSGWYVVALYHEKNRDKHFPGIRYAVEDVDQLAYISYEESFRRLAGLPWNILETDRMKVRESVVEDVEEFYRIYSEPSITYYMEDLFPCHEEERAYMEAYIKQIYGFYGFGLWTVLLKETNRIIGRAGLSIREGYDLPELGFMIDADYQKMGYGYEVCRAILEYAREELGFEKVQALVEQENQASRRLLKKLGFCEEGKIMEKGQEYLLAVRELC